MKALDDTEARGFLDRLGERSDQMGAVEFAGQRIVPRQLQELFVAGVTFVVDADDALRARRLAVGAGKPGTGFLDPEHGRRRAGPHAIFDAVRRAVAAMDRRRLGKRIERGSRASARSVWRIPPRSTARQPEYPGTPRRHGRSNEARRLRYPRQRRPGRAKPGWSRFAAGRMSRSPRFGTWPGDSRPSE